MSASGTRVPEQARDPRARHRDATRFEHAGVHVRGAADRGAGADLLEAVRGPGPGRAPAP